MKTILVPTDFSEHALYALKVAAQVAKKIHAKIVLAHVHIFPTSEYAIDVSYRKYFDQIIVQAEEKLKNLAEMDFLKGIELSKHFASNTPMWKVVCGDLFKDVDLIVVGSHGAGGFNQAFIGSNTDKIIRMAPAPVLTIKNEPTVFEINSMVFASNFFDESYPAFKRIKFFADIYQSHIYLLKIITPKYFESTTVSEKLLYRFAQRFGLEDYSIHIFNAPRIESGIIEFGNIKDADLIAIETHGRTGFAHLINGSLAEGIAKHEPKPVLSIKIPSSLKPASNPIEQRTDYENFGEG